MAEAVEADGAEPVDGDDDAPDYAWILERDAALRCFILKHYGAAAYEIDARIFIANMDDVFDWIKTGKKPRRRNLEVVNNKIAE